jgi:hypothetical protein
MTTYDVLVMGASYGSLLATKLLFGGHKVKLICLPEEADLINAEGTRVRLPVKGREDLVEIDSRKLPGTLSAGVPSLPIRPTTIWWCWPCRSRSTACLRCAAFSSGWRGRVSRACP